MRTVSAASARDPRPKTARSSKLSDAKAPRVFVMAVMAFPSSAPRSAEIHQPGGILRENLPPRCFVGRKVEHHVHQIAVIRHAARLIDIGMGPVAAPNDPVR